MASPFRWPKKPSRSTIPSWSSESSSSRAEHSMPWLSWPRILLAWMTVPPGSFAPTVASGTTIPGLTLGAPHTTRTSAVPSVTRHSVSRSALGWRLTSSTFATTTPGKLRPLTSSPST